MHDFRRNLSTSYMELIKHEYTWIYTVHQYSIESHTIIHTPPLTIDYPITVIMYTDFANESIHLRTKYSHFIL